MTGTASRLETRAMIRSHVREHIDRDDIELLYEHAGVLMHLAAAGLVVCVIAIVAEAFGGLR